MKTIAAIFGSAVAVASAAVFQDTPLTTELWSLCAKSDATKTDDALEAFLFNNPDVALARSADHRGGVWWAWENRNSFALGALKAYGADPMTPDEDLEGNSPKSMCSEDCDELVGEIEKTESLVLERKKYREEQAEKELDEDDDDDDDDGLDDEEPAATPKKTAKAAAPKRKSAKEEIAVDVEEDEDEDL